MKTLQLGRGIIDLSRVPRRPSPSPRLRTRSIPCNVSCSATLANSAPRARSAEELQDVYGRQGLNFLEVAGTTVADLKLENGCKARVVLPTAQITSYAAHMWHGGEEELLYTVRSRKGDLTAESLRGGISLDFSHGEDPASGILSPSTGSWNVENVQCNAKNYAQITLRRSSIPAVGVADPERGLQFRYVVTLTDESLSSAVVVKNVGRSPVEFNGSITSHLALSSVEGTFVLGLNRCDYLSLTSDPTEQLDKAFYESKITPPIWDSETKARLSKPTSDVPLSQRNSTMHEGEQACWRVENEDYSQLRGGEGRLYPTPPSSFTVLDRGFRRSLIVQRVGFEEFWLSNSGPGMLQDWNKFLCIGPTQNFQSVLLLTNEEWRAAQILTNPGFD